VAFTLAGLAAVAEPAVVEAPPPDPVPTIMLVAPAQPLIPFINLPPPPTVLPQSIRDLARTAFDARDDDAWKSILKLARRTNPGASAQIEAIEAEYTARRAEEAARQARERAERLAAASPLEYWKGEVELGGSRSTGNTDSVAVYGAVRFEREGLNWRHLINGRIDFQRSDDVTTADRWKFAWQPSFKANDIVFVYGLTQYERDRFLGFHNRYTLSAGVGWTLITSPAANLSIQGGPAVRYTDYVDQDSQATGAARASLAFRWKLTPTLSITQDAALYLETGDTNANATTTLETRLIGNLKARLSYDIQYEDRDIAGREPLDTTSRATLVYSF
jgi:putative salt-induced outer membrane protein